MLKPRGDAAWIPVAIQSGSRPANELCLLVTSVPAIMAGRRAIRALTRSYHSSLPAPAGISPHSSRRPAIITARRDRVSEVVAVVKDADLWLLTDLFAGLVTYCGMLDLPMPGPEEVVQVLLRGFTPN
ncbi:hypothetical protein [Nonomuraea sp. NPDC052265]|uniref:hypothetical protein n=1 Tax=Nonomuraea sp. NPDC052265 TaxID=3364374 RepID=UPI0037CA9379